MAYNYLRSATSIRNSTLCIHDTSAAYRVAWYENGNLEGWDSYSLLHTYGVWDNVLFGTSFGGDAYFSRSTLFPPVEAEDYYVITFQMKIVVENSDLDNITGGKIQWQRTADQSWDTDKETEFTVYTDNRWRLYSINLGPEQWWQGDIRNLRIYPFLNSRTGDQFFIRNLAIRSPSSFKCTQPACDYYPYYTHPCPGVGLRGFCKAKNSVSTVDIVEDVNDVLIVNIDDYGEQPIRLIPASGLTRKEISQEIEKSLTRIDTGGYVNAIVEEDVDKIKISSGTFADDSSVELTHTQLAEDLGFFTGSTDVSTKTTGDDPASEFEFQATYRLRGVEIFKLIDGDAISTAFYHDPSRFEVEAGRQDWQERTKGVVAGEVEYDYLYTPTFSGSGYTIVDFTHPFNSSGRVRHIYVMGSIPDTSSGAKIKIFRPKKDGSLETVYSTTFGQDDPSYIYSKVRDTYIVDVDVRVRKGDLLGFYGIDLYLGDVISENPDALFYYFSGEASGDFDPGELLAFGNLGLNYYARGDNRQDLVLLDIDMGDRVSMESLLFYGEEETEDFEFNIAICDDVSWKVNLYGGVHNHYVNDAFIPENSYYATHNNIAYGRLLLNDGITHTEDALAGTSYGDGVNNNGFYTAGTTYFYVNGDAEWVNESPGESATPLNRYTTYPPEDFEQDPVALTLTFSDVKNFHKTRVFFKDRENFIKFHWSYYVGYNHGNTYDLNYTYIPSYNVVSIDDTSFTPDYEDDNVVDYLFTNPTDGSWTVGEYDSGTGYYALGGDQDAAMAASVLRWNVLTHEFDTVNSKSIRFYTNYHKSTKMMEIEVYSKVSNDPSLLDDVFLQYSREGTYWFDSVFTEQNINGEDITSALINDNPRYLTLEIRSSSVIKFKEFDLRLNSDAVRTGSDKCLSDLHFNTTKRGEINPAKSFPIWNTFEEAVDFRVDIPRDEGDDHLILWSKMGSDDEIEFPEVGPGGSYYKNPDYQLYNKDYNVAINCPCWGLRNLADGKKVYYSYDGESWGYWGTYASGTAINFSHPGKRRTTFEFTPVSAQYFKLVPHAAEFANITEVSALFNDVAFDTSDFDVYTLSSISPTAKLITKDSTLKDLDPNTGSASVKTTDFYIDDFADGVIDTAKWRKNSAAYLSETGGYLYSAFTDFDQDASIDSRYTWFFPYTERFKITCRLEVISGWSTPSSSKSSIYMSVIGVDQSGYTMKVERMNEHSFGDSYEIYSSDGSGGGGAVEYVVGSPTWMEFTIESYAQDRLRGSFVDSVGTTKTSQRTNYGNENTGFYVTLGFESPPDGTVPVVRFEWVKVELGGSDGSIGIGFDHNEAVDSLTILHDPLDFEMKYWYDKQNQYDPFTDIDIYVSYDNITYYFWETVSSYTVKDDPIYVFLAMDLEKRYSLDFVRTYGSGAGETDIEKHTIYYDYETTDPATLNPLDGLTEYTFTDVTDAQFCNDDSHTYRDWGTTKNSAGVQYIGSERFRSVIKFDFSSLTDIGFIFESKLNLKITNKWGAAANDEAILQLYECLFNWTGDSDNVWNPTSSQIGSTKLAEVTLDPTSGYYDWRYLYGNVSANALITNWINGETANYGFYIIEKHDYFDNYSYSNESRVGWGNDTHATPPKLDLIYKTASSYSGNKNDCRWLVVVLFENDSIQKLGAYPDLDTVIAPGGGYNHSWDDLGNVLTDYDIKTNVAFDATVSGSSSTAGLIPEFAVDGNIPDGDITKIWGTDDSASQQLKIYLDNNYYVDEFRCYWGYYTADDAWLVTDYKIYTSTDDITYTERVSISSNTEHFRNHVLDSPVQAKYIRIDISGYDAGSIPILTENGTVNFQGATLREIEVLEADVGTSIDSETYPVVAVNLKDKFQLSGYELIQTFPEDTTTYWDNESVRYSGYTFDVPYKIKFGAAGVPAFQDQWIAIKNDTATEWNSGPDYLENVKIYSSNYHLIYKYPWWWQADYSILSANYSIETTGQSLQITYTGGPTTSGIDTVEFIEGTHLGTDTYFSDSDLITFDLYVPDISKLDDYGSIIFGDYSGLRYHVWDFADTVPTLSNGWNSLELKFRDADSKVTNQGVASPYSADEAALNNYEDLQLKSFKFRFRGKGDPLTLYLDNLKLARNKFYDTVHFGKGLYLCHSEFIQFPISEFDPHKGTLEFWFKPDYNYYGMDNFFQFDSRTIFCYSNVANDLFGLYLLKGRGFAIVTGSSEYMNIEYVGSDPDYYFNVGDVFHLAFVWSNDGTEIDSHGTTIRLYINNQLVGVSTSQWEIRETKSSRLILGGAVSQKATSEDPTTIWGAVDNLKVYNYCKTDFVDRIVEGIDSIDILSPNSFLEISNDNINFYDRNSDQLPLIYNNVPVGESRTVWIRTNIPDDLTGLEKRTAQLIVEAIRSF